MAALSKDATKQIILQKSSPASGFDSRPSGTEEWLGEWSAEHQALFLARGALDFPIEGTTALDPPPGRVRLRFNPIGNAFEFVDDAGAVFPIGGGGSALFLALADTPGSYAGAAGRVVTVNVAEDAVEFSPASGGSGSVILDEWLMGDALSYQSETQFAADVVEYNRVYLSAGVTLGRGQLELTNNTGPGSPTRLGLYNTIDPTEPNYNTINGRPNNRIAQSNLGVIGAGAFTFNYQVAFLIPTSGYYYTAIVRGAAGGQKRYRSTGGLNRFVVPRWVGSSTGGGALPATATALAPPGNDTPAILVTTKV